MVTNISKRYTLTGCASATITFETPDGELISTVKLSSTKNIGRDLTAELFYRMNGAPLVWLVAYQKDDNGADVPTYPLPIPNIPRTMSSETSTAAYKNAFGQAITLVKAGLDVYFTETPHIPRSGLKFLVRSDRTGKPAELDDETVIVSDQRRPRCTSYVPRKEF